MILVRVICSAGICILEQIIVVVDVVVVVVVHRYIFGDIWLMSGQPGAKNDFEDENYTWLEFQRWDGATFILQQPTKQPPCPKWPQFTKVQSLTSSSNIETLPISNRYASASLGKVFLDFFELITTFWEGLVTFFLLIKVEFTGRRLRENWGGAGVVGSTPTILLVSRSTDQGTQQINHHLEPPTYQRFNSQPQSSHHRHKQTYHITDAVIVYCYYQCL